MTNEIMLCTFLFSSFLAVMEFVNIFQRFYVFEQVKINDILETWKSTRQRRRKNLILNI